MYRSTQLLQEPDTGVFYYDVYHREQEDQESIRYTKVVWNSTLKRWYCSRDESMGFGVPCRHEVFTLAG